MKIKDKFYQPIRTAIAEPINRTGLVAIGALMIACLALVLVTGLMAKDLSHAH